MVIEQQITEQKLEFLIEVNSSQLFLDRRNKIVLILWQGVVEVETAKEILLAGSQLIENGSAKFLLLNRKELDKFSKEASSWIKDDLLKNTARRLVQEVEKVATIGSRSTIGNLFSNIISTAIRIVFPTLKMRNFESTTEANEWLTA